MTKNDSFDYTVETSKDVDVVVNDLRDTLKEKGFGVMSVLDFKAILKEKGFELKNEYRLLEVCNPNAAKSALETDLKVGLLLPCTIAVYKEYGRTKVSLLKPTKLLEILPHEKLKSLGEEMEPKLKEAIQTASTKHGN
ncbi:MAG: DUF302 domain-containing protein [Nitrososphaerales archaeon]